MKQLLSRIFRTKSLRSILEESERPDRKLKRVLGPVDLILLGIGAIIGAGIFATVGTATAGDALRPGAGPAIVLSFAITGIVCGLAALCYAELASFIPISGSAYTYTYATFGELLAWIIGWDLMLEYIVGAIAVSISWSGYFQAFLRGFGISLPTWLTIDFRTAVLGFNKATALISSGTSIGKLNTGLQIAWSAVNGAPHLFGIPIIFNLPAVFIVLFLSSILIIGIKESSRLNNGMVVIKLLVLGFFVAIGAFFIKPINWIPFAPNGFAGIKAGAAIAFFAYIGFDAISTTAEETKNPKRNLPIGILGSLAICTIIYMLVSAVFTGILPYSLLKDSLAHLKAEPLTLALSYVNLNWASVVVALGSIVAHIAVLLVLIMGQSKNILFNVARWAPSPDIFKRT